MKTLAATFAALSALFDRLAVACGAPGERDRLNRIAQLGYFYAKLKPHDRADVLERIEETEYAPLVQVGMIRFRSAPSGLGADNG